MNDDPMADLIVQMSRSFRWSGGTVALETWS